MPATTEPTVDTWQPAYSPWRHGGWYVDNIRYPSGASGCVSRNYPDRKWRIVCDPRPGSFPGGPNDHTYPSRDAAARAERELAEATQSTEACTCGSECMGWCLLDGLGCGSQPAVNSAEPPTSYEYRVMYRHYDGTEIPDSEGLSEDAADRRLDKVRAGLAADTDDRRSAWIERRPIGSWERVS